MIFSSPPIHPSHCSAKCQQRNRGVFITLSSSILRMAAIAIGNSAVNWKGSVAWREGKQACAGRVVLNGAVKYEVEGCDEGALGKLGMCFDCNAQRRQSSVR